MPVPLAVQVLGGQSSRKDAFPLLREERARAKERVLTPALRAQTGAALRVRAIRFPLARVGKREAQHQR